MLRVVDSIQRKFRICRRLARKNIYGSSCGSMVLKDLGIEDVPCKNERAGTLAEWRCGAMDRKLPAGDSGPHHRSK
jgi:hypothetical protein